MNTETTAREIAELIASILRDPQYTTRDCIVAWADARRVTLTPRLNEELDARWKRHAASIPYDLRSIPGYDDLTDIEWIVEQLDTWNWARETVAAWR